MDEKDNKNSEINNDNEESVDMSIELKDMTIDKIIINLKIIALIKKYEKLSISEDDNSLIIDDKTNLFYIQSIKRWINDDNRQKTMSYIDRIIHKTFETMDQVYEEYKTQDSLKNENDISEEIFEEDKVSLLLRLSKEIINAAEGLKNLRQTYKCDSLVNSQIQLLLDKIKIKVEKINTALNVKWIIDKEYQSNNNYGT